ncbi:CBO0543 family protein [Metabacillus herbersteinensis]|uniref:CBO0543 family protein n=1 Tax=Metabacillus herbersteinensis TaxID=283816 RepID=A0ABV6GMG3_9BACI
MNVVFLNYYPTDKNIRNKIIYIATWSVFAVVFEKFYLWSGTFYYNGWKLWYSAILYPFLYLSLYLCLRYVRKLLNSYLKEGK